MVCIWRIPCLRFGRDILTVLSYSRTRDLLSCSKSIIICSLQSRGHYYVKCVWYIGLVIEINCFVWLTDKEAKSSNSTIIFCFNTLLWVHVINYQIHINLCVYIGMFCTMYIDQLSFNKILLYCSKSRLV